MEEQNTQTIENENLLNATSHENLNDVERALKNGADVNHKDNDGDTALIVASIEGNKEIVQFLLDNGADIEAKDNSGFTALFWVVYNEDKEMAQFLLDNGADIEAKYDDGFTALHWSIYSKNQEIAQFLLDNRADIEAKDDMGNTALFRAVYNKDKEMAQFLLDNGADIEAKDDTGNTALLHSIDYIKYELIKNIEDITNEEIFAIPNLYDGDIEMAQLLLDNGANIEAKDNKGNTALIKASSHGNIEIAQFLLDNGADIEAKNNINGETALIKASSSGNIEMVQLLLDNGADIEAKHKSTINMILRLVISFRKNKVLKFIVYSILDLFEGINSFLIKYTAKEDNGSTALVKASHNGHKDVVKLLIKNGADVDHIQYKKKVSINPKVKEIMVSMVEFILKLIFRGTPLHSSVNTKELQLIEEKELQSDFIGHCKYLQNQKETMSNPQKLITILTNFTIDTPIKYTTHLWDFGDIKKEYGSFQGFIEAISKQWKSIEKELKELSPNLHTKIYNFLLNKSNEHSWCSRADISIGWSSLDGLEAWCNEGNNPFDFKLKENYEVDNKTLTTFGEVINLFKREIEIRNENNMLESIFLEEQKKLGRKFNVDLVKLKGRTFYTDVAKFKESIGRIFEEIKKRDDAHKIRVEVLEPDAESIELKITQLNSFANRSAKEMLEEVDDGDFKILKESLINLCDWSIESSYEQESYRVNYLRSSKIQEIEKPILSIDGFTHMLRFYKK